MKVYLIGSSSLLIQCTLILLHKKWDIKGIVSTDTCVKKWATLHHIPVLTLQNIAIQKPGKVDFLFSIVNPYILTKKILALPRFYAINFHDSPLPRYAGIHATNWTILNQESTHAISWHTIDVGIDTGDILIQLPITVKPNDTAYTLNIRCFDKALTGFEKLIDQLQQNIIDPTPQNLSNRTYYGGQLKPPFNGIVRWNWPATIIYRLARATYYADYANDFSSIKMCLNNEWFLINEKLG